MLMADGNYTEMCALLTAEQKPGNSADAVPSPSDKRTETITSAGAGLGALASATLPDVLLAKYS